MNRKTILIAGSLLLALLLTFFGGLKLGHNDLYQDLVFGNNSNEIFVKVDFNGKSVFIKRHRDTDTISIVSPNKFSSSASLDNVEGIKKFNWRDDQLTLVKINTAQWENIIANVLKEVIPQKSS